MTQHNKIAHDDDKLGPTYHYIVCLQAGICPHVGMTCPSSSPSERTVKNHLSRWRSRPLPAHLSVSRWRLSVKKTSWNFFIGYQVPQSLTSSIWVIRRSITYTDNNCIFNSFEICINIFWLRVVPRATPLYWVAVAFHSVVVGKVEMFKERQCQRRFLLKDRLGSNGNGQSKEESG